MEMIELTVTLPEDLVQRAQTAGVRLDNSSIASMIETELIRANAVTVLRDAMTRLGNSLTLEEIEAELALAKSERSAQQAVEPK